MLVSIGAYTLIWGWKFAVGLRPPAARPRDGPRVPGAAGGPRRERAALHPVPRRGDRAEGAAQGRGAWRRASAWPARSSARSARSSPVAIWLITGDELFQALAFFGFFLNLFNLAPVLPLDGGRAMAALTPWMWIVGYALLVVATVFFPNPIMLLILIFGGLETYRRWKVRKDSGAAALLRGQAAHAGGRRGHLHRASARPRRRHGGHLPRAGLQ